MKKKLLSILLTVAMAATLLAGCGNSKEAAGEQGNDAAQQEAPESGADAEKPADAEEPADAEAAGTGSAEGKFVGFTLPSIGNDFLLALSEGVKGAVEDMGAEIQVDSADGDVTTQIEQIENYITMDADLIVVFAINGESVANVCKQALDADIPVLAFAVEIPGAATTTMLSAEDADMGNACAEMTSTWIDENFPDAEDGSVNVLVLGSSMTPQIVERSEGLKTIESNSKVTMNYIEAENHDSVDDCRSKVENAFLENSDYDVIMCVTGTAGIGAESFIASSDSPITDISKFAIFCTDETEEIDAKIAASANNESALRGTISMGSIQDTVNDFLTGATPILTDQEPIEMINGGVKMVTAETLAE